MKVMLLLKLILFVSLVSSANIHNEYFANNNNQDSLVLNFDSIHQESFVDSLYGELVNGEAELEYVKEKLISGELRLPESIEEVNEFQATTLIEQISELSNNDEIVQFFSNLKHNNFQYEATAKEARARKSHQAYMKYKAKLTLPNDNDTSDLSEDNPNLFGGIVTFAHFMHFDCFNPNFNSKNIDIAVVGAPFDTGTSYRPGARMGPHLIRSASRRLGEGITPVRSNGSPNSKLPRVNPYNQTSHNLTIIDCGDVPMTPFDNKIALNQLYRGLRSIHNHPSKQNSGSSKIIMLGGDHTVSLFGIRSAFEKFGQLAVLHFDSHIDTWNPNILGGGLKYNYESLNHGTFLHYAAEKGYLSKNHCSHIGLRAPYIVPEYDIDHDKKCGFQVITARDLDSLGTQKIVDQLKELVKDKPVYITVDIDVLDPSTAPGTGTMEAGGWTSRELLSVLDGLEGVNIVGGDIVEVSPPYDTNSEITSLAATSVVDSLLGLMIVNEIK